MLGGMIALFMIFFSMNGLLMKQNSSQSKADSMALSFAETINENDRIGQINELEACNRELVFTSRQRLRECRQKDLDILEPLCSQLVTEARSGHHLIEQERRNQLELICRQLKQSAEQQNEQAAAQSNFSLAFLQTKAPMVTRIDIGHISNIESNVKPQGVVQELAAFDAEHGFLNKRSKLLKANLNAKLPAEDSDLDFYISGLAARVGDTCSPARNVNADVFVRSGTILGPEGEKYVCVDKIPNAVQITCSMNAAIGNKHEHSQSLQFISTGAATGAIAGQAR